MVNIYTAIVEKDDQIEDKFYPQQVLQMNREELLYLYTKCNKIEENDNYIHDFQKVLLKNMKGHLVQLFERMYDKQDQYPEEIVNLMNDIMRIHFGPR